MIRYEIKKYVFRRRNLALLLLMTLLFCGVLVFSEWKCMVEKNLRQDFFDKMGNHFSETTRASLEEEQEELFNRLYPQDAEGAITVNQDELLKKGKYSDTQLDDYALLGDAIDCIDTVEKRNSNLSILRKNNQGAMSSEYAEEHNDCMADRMKLTVIARTLWFGWPACICLVLIFGTSVSIEHEKQLLPVLGITCKGEGALYIAKMAAAFLTAIAVNLYFFAVYMVIQFLFVGMGVPDLHQPLFLVENYELCASRHTLLSLIVMQEIFALLLSLMVAFITMVCSKAIKKGIFATISAFIVFGAGVIFDLLNLAIYQNDFHMDVDNWYIVSVTTFYKIFAYDKKLNPFSLIQFQYYISQPRFITFGTIRYPLYFLPLIIMIIILCAGSLYLLQGGLDRRGGRTCFGLK